LPSIFAPDFRTEILPQDQRPKICAERLTSAHRDDLAIIHQAVTALQAVTIKRRLSAFLTSWASERGEHDTARCLRHAGVEEQAAIEARIAPAQLIGELQGYGLPDTLDLSKPAFVLLVIAQAEIADDLGDNPIMPSCKHSTLP
jgi:hypothetical protein